LLANVADTAGTGSRMTLQKLALRNNCIAVFNLQNMAWESIDWLPAGVAADWLRSCERTSQRRLFVIDAQRGPWLFEEGDVDETGDVTGGTTLPLTLPTVLQRANFASVPVAGKLVTRSYRWDSAPRKIKQAEARATFDTAGALTLQLNVRTPNHQLWQSARSFVRANFNPGPDAALRKLCGERGLEASVTITTTSGRPTLRSIDVETAAVGKVPE
jgi:hypothetical protein